MKNESTTLLEICCGCLEDALVADETGADRIELNSALYLGGLTPSMATLQAVKEGCSLPVWQWCATEVAVSAMERRNIS